MAFTSGLDDYSSMRSFRRILFVLIILVVLSILLRILLSFFETRTVYTNIDVTHRELRFAFLELARYSDKAGRSPTSIYEAATSDPIESIPSRWKTSNRAIDPWGTPYLFLIEKNVIKVWSCGQNRKNEDGGGDDIVIEEPHYIAQD